MPENYLEYIEELEKALKESTNCLTSILYTPEQVNWSHDSEYKPIWLKQRILNNEYLLEKPEEKV